MKHVLLFTVIISFVYAPMAFAEGPLLASAKRAGRELGQAGVQPATRLHAESLSRRTANSPALSVGVATAQSQGSGMSRAAKMWLAIGVGAVLAGTMWAIDHNVEDRTLSTLGKRQDGCQFLC
jgi:hypothetical protein